MDRLIIAVLVLALGYFAFDKFSSHPTARSGAPWPRPTGLNGHQDSAGQFQFGRGPRASTT